MWPTELGSGSGSRFVRRTLWTERGQCPHILIRVVANFCEGVHAMTMNPLRGCIGWIFPTFWMSEEGTSSTASPTTGPGPRAWRQYLVDDRKTSQTAFSSFAFVLTQQCVSWITRMIFLFEYEMLILTEDAKIYWKWFQCRSKGEKRN